MGKEIKVSQEELLKHSEIKVRLLKYYLEAYINILSHASYYDRLYFFDLFCGPGIYKNGGKGSPVILLEEIKKLKNDSNNSSVHNTKFNCYFNDIKVEKINKLINVIDEKKLFNDDWGKLEFKHLDYKDTLIEIPQYLINNPNSKGFAFVDPYGYKEIRIKDIKQLLNTGKIEILLFLPIHYIYRFKDSDNKPKAIKDFLFDLGLANNTYSTNQGVEFITDITEAFRTVMNDKYYVDSFLIDRSKNQFFSIFYFSSSIYGFEKMIDAKWKIDKLEGKGWQSSSEFDLFNQGGDLGVRSKLDGIIRNYIGESTRSNAQLYEQTLRNGFRPTHATEVLKELQKNNKIEVVDKYNNACRKGAFYLNYKCYRDEPQKAFFKLK